MSRTDFRRLLDIGSGDGAHGRIGLECEDGETLHVSIWDPGARSPHARARLSLQDAQLLFDQLAAACVVMMQAQGDPVAARVLLRDTPDTPAA